MINFFPMEEEGANICAPFVAHNHCAKFVEKGRDDGEDGEVGRDGGVAIESAISIKGKEGGGECAFNGKKRNICFLCEFP